jgi:PAS domain S-box-containing protein/putative nucleotidyltransferase with HDIG domain
MTSKPKKARSNPEAKSVPALLAENRAFRQKLRQREAFDALQKKKEESARSGRALFKNLLQSSPVVFYAREPFGDFGFTYISENVRQQLGVPATQFMRTPKFWESRIHFEEAGRTHRVLAELPAQAQGRLSLEYRFLHADGRYHWLKDDLRLIRNAEGLPLEIEGHWLDVTDRRRLEESLSDEAARYHKLAETVGEIVWTRDAEGHTIAISPNAREILGFEPGELLNMRRRLWWKRIQPEDAVRVRAAFQGLILDGRPYTVDYRIKRSDESWLEVREKGIVRRKNDGLVLADGTVVELIRDRESAIADFIDERRRLEGLLQRSEERFRLLVDNMPSGVAVYEPRDDGRDFIIKDFNRAAERIDGAAREDILNRSVLQVFPGVVPLGLLDVFQRVWKTGRPEHHPASLYRDERVVSWRDNFVYKLPTGEIVAIYDDVTERKMAEAALLESYRKNQKALAATVESMAEIGEQRDPFTAEHQKRAAGLARAIAGELGLPRDKVEEIHIGGRLHDIGMISLPLEILSKPGKVTDVEFERLKMHTKLGADIVRKADFSPAIVNMVLHHHERLDGTGYPDGLKRGEIGLEAMCLAVADVVEAMSSDRPHRPAAGIDKALEEIERNKGVLYDERVADTCLTIFREKGFKLG